MLFEPNKFYTHTEGRSIHTLEYVKTIRWGKILVIEETDHTGHAMSFIDDKALTPDQTENWTEISKKEFMINYKSREKRSYGSEGLLPC